MALPKVKYPKYELTIPSTGENVQYRPFTVAEEKILLTALQGEDSKEIAIAVGEIISSCTFGSVKIDTLAQFDIEYIFLKIRIKSVASEIQQNLRNNKCPEEDGKPCKKVVRVTLNLDEAKVQQYDAKSEAFVDYDHSKASKLGERILLQDDLGVTIQYPGMKAIESVTAEDEYTQTAQLICACITSVYDEDSVTLTADVSAEEVMTFYESLLSPQKEKLKEFIESTPTVRYESVFKCPTCGVEEPIEYRGLESFFG